MSAPVAAAHFEDEELLELKAAPEEFKKANASALVAHANRIDSVSCCNSNNLQIVSLSSCETNRNTTDNFFRF